MGGGESSDTNEKTGRAARHGRPITEEQRETVKRQR
jgi:plasmid stability protein